MRVDDYRAPGSRGGHLTEYDRGPALSIQEAGRDPPAFEHLGDVLGIAPDVGAVGGQVRDREQLPELAQHLGLVGTDPRVDRLVARGRFGRGQGQTGDEGGQENDSTRHTRPPGADYGPDGSDRMAPRRPAAYHEETRAARRTEWK